MRPLEAALSLLCLVLLGMAVLGFKTARGVALLLFFMPALLLACHAYAEGLRWHLTPVYAVAAALALVGILLLAGVHFTLPWWATRLAALGAASLVIMGIFLAWVFPVFTLPPLSGPHQIGTCEVHLTDPTRPEIAPNSSGGKRELMVQFWYPATPGTGGKLAPYLSMAEIIIRPWANLSRVQTHAREDAEVEETAGGWPVILYSPSWGGGRGQNTALCEALASEGFIVAAIDHPFISPRVRFPDGRIVTNEGLPPFDFSSEVSGSRFLHDTAVQLEIRTADLLQVFIALSGLQAGELGDDRFKDKLNTALVGAAGYSFGGATAAEACFREPRLRAGLNLDGTLFGEAAKTGATQPFLFITDDEAIPSKNELGSANPNERRAAEFSAKGLSDQNLWLETRGGWLVQFSGVTHANFSDSPLYSHLRRFNGAGSRDSRQTLILINTLAVSFFNLTLRGQSSDFWKPGFQSPWPDVKFETFKPASKN